MDFAHSASICAKLHTVCFTWGLDPLKSELVSLRPWVWPQLQRASDNNAQHNLPMEMSPLIFMLPRVRSPISQHDASYGNGGMGIFMPSTLATYTFHLHIAPPLRPAKKFPSRIALRQRCWRKYRNHWDCADWKQCVVKISFFTGNPARFTKNSTEFWVNCYKSLIRVGAYL